MMKGEIILEKRKLNAKTQWIYSSMDAVEIFRSEDQDKKISFITPYGIIVGEYCELEEYDFSDKNTLIEKIQNEKSVNFYGLIESLYAHNIKTEYEDVDFNDGDKRIYLKNVTIISNNTNINNIKTDTLMIFTDQIISVIPSAVTVDR